MLGAPYNIDPERIARSVFKEFSLDATVSTSPAQNDPTLWLMKVRYPNAHRDMHVALRCGPGATSVSVRQSLIRQLKLEA